MTPPRISSIACTANSTNRYRRGNSRRITASLLTKRSVVIARHKTSICLEDGFWTELRRFARQDGLRLTDVIGDIDVGRRNRVNLSSAIRIYVLDRMRREALAESATAWATASEGRPD